MLKNYAGTEYSKSDKYVNNEIEDLMYSEIIVNFVNSILAKRGMNEIDIDIVCKKISASSFIKNGILSLCENEKNSNNQDLSTYKL